MTIGHWEVEVGWERARQPEQKRHRRRAILDAAGELFDEGGLDGTSLTAIARASGLSKANLYRYFESREAILLELLSEQIDAWVTALERALASLPPTKRGVETVAGAVTEAWVTRPRLAGLHAVLMTVLDHNVTPSGLVPFKQHVVHAYLRATNALHAALPALGVEQAGRFLEAMTFASGSAWAKCHPPDSVREALASPELAAWASKERDYAELVEDIARVLLRGLLAEPAE